MKIIRYEKKYKTLWDDFINKSKNGTFLFYRNYMEYHSDRFKDYSLMFFIKNKLIAIMPANIKENVLISHGGLTYGGIISDYNMKTPVMLEIFKTLKNYLKKEGITEVLYKAIPHIYHLIPAEEDLYALFLNNAKRVRCDLSSTIFMKEMIHFSKSRKWSIKKSNSSGLEVRRTYEYETFMKIEKNLLKQKYGIKTTHTEEEMRLLANRFPENIKLFAAYLKNNMVAGVIIYESKNVAHTQYIAFTDEGKKLFAHDLILSFLIEDYYTEKKYFDFGISTENNGRYLNVGLDKYKESFGARAITYNFYKMDLTL